MLFSGSFGRCCPRGQLEISEDTQGQGNVTSCDIMLWRRGRPGRGWGVGEGGASADRTPYQKQIHLLLLNAAASAALPARR